MDSVKNDLGATKKNGGTIKRKLVEKLWGLQQL